jgi:hypothetical protein
MKIVKKYTYEYVLDNYDIDIVIQSLKYNIQNAPAWHKLSIDQHNFMNKIRALYNDLTQDKEECSHENSKNL